MRDCYVCLFCNRTSIHYVWRCYLARVTRKIIITINCLKENFNDSVLLFGVAGYCAYIFVWKTERFDDWWVFQVYFTVNYIFFLFQGHYHRFVYKAYGQFIDDKRWRAFVKFLNGNIAFTKPFNYKIKIRESFRITKRWVINSCWVYINSISGVVISFNSKRWAHSFVDTIKYIKIFSTSPRFNMVHDFTFKRTLSFFFTQKILCKKNKKVLSSNCLFQFNTQKKVSH